MIRIAGTLLIFLTSAAVGMFLSNSIKNKKERLIKERKMLEEISIMIRFNSFTLKEIIFELENSGLYNDFKFLNKLTIILKNVVSFPVAWEQAVKEDDILYESEKKLLTEIVFDGAFIPLLHIKKIKSGNKAAFIESRQGNCRPCFYISLKNTG